MTKSRPKLGTNRGIAPDLSIVRGAEPAKELAQVAERTLQQGSPAVAAEVVARVENEREEATVLGPAMTVALPSDANVHIDEATSSASGDERVHVFSSIVETSPDATALSELSRQNQHHPGPTPAELPIQHSIARAPSRQTKPAPSASAGAESAPKPSSLTSQQALASGRRRDGTFSKPAVRLTEDNEETRATTVTHAIALDASIDELLRRHRGLYRNRSRAWEAGMRMLLQHHEIDVDS